MEAKLREKAEALANQIATDATSLDELNGLMRTLMKTALEGMLNSELDIHLCRKELASQASSDLSETPSTGQRRNRRNGHSPKTIQGELGEVAFGYSTRS